MKKAISVALALVMLFAVCIPAFAADISATGTGDVIVSTSTKTATGEDAETYTVTIPADTTIAWGTESTDVSYTVESHLARNKAVSVAVAGSGEMKTVDGAYTLAYTLDGATAFTAEHPVVYPAAAQAINVLIAADDWNTAVVESYSDVLTYTAEVIAA